MSFFLPILATLFLTVPHNADFSKLLADNLQPFESAALLDLKTSKLYTHNEQALLELHRAGSVFKVVSAAALLHENLGTEVVTCHGEQNFAGHDHQRCWTTRGHGSVNLQQAIAQSCNIYFYTMAEQLPFSSFRDQLLRWQLDRPSGYDRREAWPQIPLSLTKTEQADCMVGDCDQLLLSGLSLLKVAATIADERNPDAPIELRHAMLRVVEQGTAKKSQIKAIKYAGKTGTARRLDSWHYEGWFIGFFPFDCPRYALVVYNPLTQGKDSAASAAKLITAINEAAGLSCQVR